MKKLLSLLLALLMALSLVACGGDDPVDEQTTGSFGSPDAADTAADDDTSGGEVTGGTDGFGDFASILVPEEFEFQRDSWNEENPHFVSVKRSDFAYFDFHNYTEEAELMKEYEYVKRTYTNEQTDVSANYGGIDWIGFQYGDGYGGYGFEAYAIMGSNYLKVASGGFAFDNEIAQAILGSVVMSDGSGATGDADTTGMDRTDTEVGGAYSGGMEWLRYWTGNWYGWWLMTDGTGLYGDWNDGAGEGVWDACAYIESHEDMTGTMELWDSDGSWDEVIALIDLGFANPDDTEYGVMSCEGGQFFGDTLESGDWIVDPDSLAYENIFDFRGDYEDEYGTFSYRVLLRPWGILWDDLGEAYYPEHYYDWYLPLVETGADMPSSIG